MPVSDVARPVVGLDREGVGAAEGGEIGVGRVDEGAVGGDVDRTLGRCAGDGIGQRISICLAGVQRS